MGLKLFGKSEAKTIILGAAMVALVGNESASAEQVDAANQELDTAGIKGAQLVPGAVLDDLTAKADRVDAAEKAVTDTKADLKTATERADKAEAEVARLGKLPGATSTTPVREEGKSDLDEEPTDAAANQKIVDDLHAKMLGEI